jgi:hypothetical protein
MSTPFVDFAIFLPVRFRFKRRQQPAERVPEELVLKQHKRLSALAAMRAHEQLVLKEHKRGSTHAADRVQGSLC